MLTQMTKAWVRSGVMIACSGLIFAAGESFAFESEHTFSMADIQGDFAGNLYADDATIICTVHPCPGDAQPYIDKSGVELFPVDSEFGFIVSDFVGAATKTRNLDYAEGWAGDIFDGLDLLGVRVSNADTDTFKVKYPMGTWCAGLGANTVKCSTEHYTVLEHLMTCYETIPYMFADPDTGAQGELIDPETGLPFDPSKTCDLGKMDNILYVVEDGVVSETLLGPDEDGVPDLPANESTVLNDIAVNTDYGITKKDDGKPLYRFGNLIKRPNDIRLYAQMDLPAEWKVKVGEVYPDFPVTRAELVIEHLITNNPNDQVRPEDMENEGAIGRLPRYTDAGDQWTSAVECYEGDGDLIPVGTVFKNATFALPPAVAGNNTDPYGYSDDLLHAMTNGWYTTTDREPFEWSYDSNGDGVVDESGPGPDDTLGTLISGPRWRLKPNKFGQDIPGLEIPIADDFGNPGCIPVPYTSENIKYSVGDATVTTLNLLDFEDLNGNGLADDSPLLSSRGWVDASQNFVNVGPGEDNTAPNGISINGLPLTEDFDLAVYVKGDKKPTSVFNAKLVIDYDAGPSIEYDLALDSFVAPANITEDKTKRLTSYITNAGPDSAEGIITVVGVRNDGGDDITFSEPFGPIAAGAAPLKQWFEFTPTDVDSRFVVEWTAAVAGDGDTTPDNNTGTGTTNVNPATP